MTSAGAQLELECEPDRRERSRAIRMLALLTLVLALAAAFFVPGAVVLLLVPLVLFGWSALDGKLCRRLYVSDASGRIGFLRDDEAWSRADVLAVRTSSGIEPGLAGAAGHVALVPNHVFELSLWTKAKAGASEDALATLALAAQRGDPATLLRAQLLSAREALGDSHPVLVRSRSPAPVLSAARAIAHALQAPWLHEGVRGLELRTATELGVPAAARLLARAKADAQDAREPLPPGSPLGVAVQPFAGGTRLRWHVSRALAIAGVAVLFFALLTLLIASWLHGELGVPFVLVLGALAWLVYWLAAQHGTYVLEASPRELVLSGPRSFRLATRELCDIEARLDARPALCLVTRAPQGIELPVATPAAALYLAHALADALQHLDPA